ncbi:adhesion G-protein coupled receptor G2-like [Achroia grisella]|uniref:adhesion G-protein coupled receptor G2-like n=1 Tax=Achroia grisella TaxID=688607 RepID=UPI0027D21729|nr:adhesion G-protein coupled receptor G2-like [Achroia grisella]
MTKLITISQPADIINEITDDIKNKFQNPPIYITKVDKTFDKINMLLSIDEDVVFPGELLQLIQKLGMTIDLMGSQSDRIVKEKIALLIADAGDLYPVRGLRVASSDVNISVHEAFEILLMDVDSTHLTVKETDAMVHLPQSVINIPRRISFTVFNNKRVFDNEGESIVNSRVVSVNVENYTHFESGEVVTLHFKPIKEPERDQRRSCAYWHYLENGTGYWSQEGCTFISSNNPDILDSCQCDHLIHFAEILIPRPVFSEGNENALEILSVIGCSLSIFGIFFILLTVAVFETWRSKFRNQIWLQLCIALLILSICFLIILHVKYLYFSASCMFVGIVLHYSVLASFCWMFVAAAIAYKDTIPFGKHITHTVMKTSAFSWGAPIVIIGILLISAPRSYVGRFEDMTPTGSFCYPSGPGLWLSVFMPICLTLLINVIAFFYMIRVIYKSEQNTKLGKQKASYREVALKCTSTAFVLMFLFGLPWIFGLFAFNIVAAYLFTITVTIQGFVLFLFIVCGYDDTRKAWINKLQSIFNTTSRNVSKFVSSSTHLN